MLALWAIATVGLLALSAFFSSIDTAILCSEGSETKPEEGA